MIVAFDLTGAVSAVAWRFGDGRDGREAFPAADASATLTPSLERLLAGGQEPLRMLGVVKGPGSFTGIRIALATALGLQMSLEIPVLGFTVFELMAAGLGPGDYTLVLPGPGQTVFCAGYRCGKPAGPPRACPGAALAGAYNLKGIRAIEGLNVEIVEQDPMCVCLDILASEPDPARHDLEPLYL